MTHDEFRRRDVDGMVDGVTGAPDALGWLLAAARGPAQHGELAGEGDALAAFRMHRSAPAPARHPIRRTVARVLVVKVAAGVAALSVGGLAVAAATGTLPDIPDLPFTPPGQPAEVDPGRPLHREVVPKPAAPTGGTPATRTTGPGETGPGQSGQPHGNTPSRGPGASKTPNPSKTPKTPKPSKTPKLENTSPPDQLSNNGRTEHPFGAPPGQVKRSPTPSKTSSPTSSPTSGPTP